MAHTLKNGKGSGDRLSRHAELLTIIDGNLHARESTAPGQHFEWRSVIARPPGLFGLLLPCRRGGHDIGLCKSIDATQGPRGGFIYRLRVEWYHRLQTFDQMLGRLICSLEDVHAWEMGVAESE